MRFSLDTKLSIYERDGGLCFKCGAGIDYGEGNIHHRQAGGMGGSKRDKKKGLASNGLLLCADDHTWVETHRTEAIENGWIVPQNLDPELVPVLKWDGAWYRLRWDGQTVSV